MNKALTFMASALVLGGCTSEHEELPEPTPEVREVLSESGLYRVSYTPDPDPIPPVDLFSLEFLVVDAATGLPQDGMEIRSLEVGMPDHGHGMNVEPLLSDLGEGVWEASPLKFHMTGLWTMVVDLESDEGTDQAQFEVVCCESPG